MISLNAKGNFNKLDNYFQKMLSTIKLDRLTQYGYEGVRALSQATPKDTGKTAGSWDFEIIRKKHKITIAFTNSNIIDGVPVAIVLQYGHVTKTGGFVQGIDFINPAIQPVFDEIAERAWREVTRG